MTGDNTVSADDKMNEKKIHDFILSCAIFSENLIMTTATMIIFVVEIIPKSPAKILKLETSITELKQK